MKIKDTQQLGVSVYIHALRKQIEEEVKSNSSVSTSVSKVTKDGGFVAEGNNKLV